MCGTRASGQRTDDGHLWQLMWRALRCWHTAVSPRVGSQTNLWGWMWRLGLYFEHLVHSSLPQTHVCWQWWPAIWVVVKWRHSWAHFMPHRFVWNVSDLELSMCGQCLQDSWNLGSFGYKIRYRGVSVGGWYDYRCVCKCIYFKMCVSLIFVLTGLIN